MVGVGPNGERHALARCSLVDGAGAVVYDKYVKPLEKIVDYRSAVSGILPQHMATAIGLKQCQQEVAALLDGRVLVGHSVQHDLDVLFLSHPHQQTRDTAWYKGLCPHRPRALKTLAAEELDLPSLHAGTHDSVEDARVALALYRKHQVAWEQLFKRKPSSNSKTDPSSAQEVRRPVSSGGAASDELRANGASSKVPNQSSLLSPRSGTADPRQAIQPPAKKHKASHK